MIARSYGVRSEGNYDELAVILHRRRSASPAAGPAAFDDDAAAQSPMVFVVDPDQDTGRSINNLLRGYKVTVQVYQSGREFFAAYTGDQPGCLVLEQRIPDFSGLQIQWHLAERNQRPPMVYVTSGLDVSTAVALMRGGAVHVLEKPLRSTELLNAIQEALAIDQSERRKEADRRWVRESIAMLTRKERELVSLVAAAKSTKAMAAELDICSRAVELRRRAVMDKLGFKSSVELLRFAMLAWQEFSYFLESAEF